MKVMTLPEFVISINVEEDYPEAICLLEESIYSKLIKTLTS